MAEHPRFSVTIPAYNAEETLAETVTSILSQSFSDLEIVICDDGSTDSTHELARELAAGDSRVRVITQENRGSGGAYNSAVRASKGDWIVMISADDMLLPGHLEAYDEAIRQNPGASIFSSDLYYQYEDGQRELAHGNAGWRDPGSCSLTDMLHACLTGVGAAYKREVFDAVGGFPEDMYAEDYPFLLLAFARGFKHRYIDRPLAVHRRSKVQKSASAMRVREADVAALRLVLGTGLLDAEERALAKKMIRSNRLKILAWRVVIALFGSGRAASVMDRIRGRSRRA